MRRNINSIFIKVIALAMSVVMLTVVIIAGTFAWTNHDQHKTNELTGIDKIYDVTLIEDFKPKDNWKVTDSPVTKEIRVKNTGNPDAGALFVRLTFKEFMEIADQGGYEYTPDRYAIGTDGQFLTSETEPTPEWLALQGYPDHEYSLLTNAINGEKRYFIKTEAGDINGQYGKYVITGVGLGGNTNPVVAGTTRVDPADLQTNAVHDADSNGECAYPAHNLSNPTTGATFPIHNYVQWNHGAAVVALSAYTGQENVWVYNDTDPDDFYVYWIGALEPDDVTANVFESLQLKVQPDGSFYYAIHVDMEAVSTDHLADWTGIPTEVGNALNNILNGPVSPTP
ncbi:MAG: hypothetical protein LBN00_07910 [Oscillospiraceae bacterium]|nr:hypothetical protein [Oscillospiraceae bacterium]